MYVLALTYPMTTTDSLFIFSGRFIDLEWNLVSLFVPFPLRLRALNTLQSQFFGLDGLIDLNRGKVRGPSPAG